MRPPAGGELELVSHPSVRVFVHEVPSLHLRVHLPPPASSSSLEAGESTPIAPIAPLLPASGQPQSQ